MITPNTYHAGAGRDCSDCRSAARHLDELVWRVMERIECRRDGCALSAQASRGAVGPYSSLCVPHAVEQFDADALAFASTTGPAGQHRSA